MVGQCQPLNKTTDKLGHPDSFNRIMMIRNAQRALVTSSYRISDIIRSGGVQLLTGQQFLDPPSQCFVPDSAKRSLIAVPDIHESLQQLACLMIGRFECEPGSIDASRRCGSCAFTNTKSTEKVCCSLEKTDYFPFQRVCMCRSTFLKNRTRDVLSIKSNPYPASQSTRHRRAKR